MTETKLFDAPAEVELDEKDLQKGIIDTAHLFGWIVAHFRPGMNRRGVWQTPVAADGKGFPDLLMIQPATGRILIAELKAFKRGQRRKHETHAQAADRKLTVEQRRWLQAFTVAGVPTRVWTPDEWPEEITAELSGKPFRETEAA